MVPSPVLWREDASEPVLEEELVDGDDRSARVVREPGKSSSVVDNIGRERLLDDHVRAGRERGSDAFGVRVERRADVDDVDLVPGKRGVLEVDVGSPDSESRGGRELTVDDGDDGSVRAAGSRRVPASPSSPRRRSRRAGAARSVRARRCSPRGDSTSVRRGERGTAPCGDLKRDAPILPAGGSLVIS